ncbi:MAG: feruloyl esterase, partial [Clostridia bacterium]|nr:feruloyl esterase [Clostridia bacterium]
AAMEPEYVKGLILRAPAFMIPRCAREGDMLGVRFDSVPDEAEIFKGLTLDGEYIRVARTLHAEEAIDGFDGPVLILHGDEDDVVPLEDSKAAAARYKRGELVVLRGESHHFDHLQAEMTRVIRDWLKSQRT